MVEAAKPTIRHTAEAELLRRASQGDESAVQQVLQYLSSANPYLRQIMQETLHDLAETRVWGQALGCLAVQRWGGVANSPRLTDPEAWQRADETIQAAFMQDSGPADQAAKQAALLDGLQAAEPTVQQAAAYLLARRGSAAGFAKLAEALRSGQPVWRLRTIKVLGELKDGRGGEVLVQVLAAERGSLHQAARQALREMGAAATPALIAALSHPDEHIRWHAARALGELGDASAVKVLAEGLLDENAKVRWATADVLAHLGEAAVPVILTIISQQQLSEPERQAVYHALHAMPAQQTQARLKPLLEALAHTSGHLAAPGLAQSLLQSWKQG
jgi:HEAT repeat protein